MEAIQHTATIIIASWTNIHILLVQGTAHWKFNSQITNKLKKLWYWKDKSQAKIPAIFLLKFHYFFLYNITWKVPVSNV